MELIESRDMGIWKSPTRELMGIEFISDAIALLVRAWVVMLMVGAGHAEGWWDWLPPVGYLEVGFVLVIVKLLDLSGTASDVWKIRAGLEAASKARRRGDND